MYKLLLTPLISLLIMSSTLLALADPQKPVKSGTETGIVTLDGKELFIIKEKLFGYKPKDRADLVSTRLETVSKHIIGEPASISVDKGETSSAIIVNDLVIVNITEADAKSAGKSRDELAADYLNIITNALAVHEQVFGAKALMQGGLNSLIATLILFLTIITVNWLQKKLVCKLEAQRSSKTLSSYIQSFGILTADRLVTVVTTALKWSRIFLFLFLFYLYIPAVLSFFPWTEAYAPLLYKHLTDPMAVVAKSIFNYLPNLFLIAVIAAVTWGTLQILKVFFFEVGNGTISLSGFDPEWAAPTLDIVKFLVLAFAVTVSFPYLPGANSPAFKGITIFIGVLFSFGSSSAISNIIAGVILTYMKAFKIGDTIKVGETSGKVTEKTLLVTKIRTIKNIDTTIPNSVLLNSHVLNYSRLANSGELILHTTVSIGYDTPWRTVHKLLIESAGRTDNIKGEPPPFVLQTALNDFYIVYELNVYTPEAFKTPAIYSDLHANIQDVFNEAGIQIMSPHQYSYERRDNSPVLAQRE